MKLKLLKIIGYLIILVVGMACFYYGTLWAINENNNYNSQRSKLEAASYNNCLKIENDIVDGNDIQNDIGPSITSMIDYKNFLHNNEILIDNIDVDNYKTGLNLIEAIIISNSKISDSNQVKRSELLKMFNEFIPSSSNINLCGNDFSNN